jgi:hypothetical protein
VSGGRNRNARSLCGFKTPPPATPGTHGIRICAKAWVRQVNLVSSITASGRTRICVRRYRFWLIQREEKRWTNSNCFLVPDPFGVQGDVSSPSAHDLIDCRPAETGSDLFPVAITLPVGRHPGYARRRCVIPQFLSTASESSERMTLGGSYPENLVRAALARTAAGVRSFGLMVRFHEVEIVLVVVPFMVPYPVAQVEIGTGRPLGVRSKHTYALTNSSALRP